jgi:hypothetical protein
MASKAAREMARRVMAGSVGCGVELGDDRVTTGVAIY